jgi:hypothetical protein
MAQLWRLSYNHKLYIWLGHIFRMHEHNHCRKSTLHKPEGTSRVGRPAIAWLDAAEDLKTMGITNWRQQSQDHNQQLAIVKEAKVRHGL